MKLKQVNISSAFAWSPMAAEPTLLAAGSVAGAMGEDFSAEAQVEIYGCDLHSDSSDMSLLGSVSVHDRLSRLDWSPHGPARGMVAGALVEGTVCVWDADAIMRRKTEEALLCQIEAHSSSVRALQFNPMQPHLLATSGQDKELRIWSLTNPANALLSIDPTSAKNPHATEVTDLKWNLKFAHILACTTSGGQTHVWDLKAKRCTVTFQDAQHKASVNCIAWHPDLQTQVVVATDDARPTIQVWDLRKAVAPIRTLTGHTAGILSLSWCPMDSNLLMSCGRDGRTVCWNPNTGDLLQELPQQGNWVFDVQWSPLVPTLLASSSFDNALTVFSVQGSGTNAGDSANNTQTGSATAPKWLKRPCGASFAFGGKLIGFNAESNNVSIQAATYNAELVDKEARVDRVLVSYDPASLCANLCKEYAEGAVSETDKMTWSVLGTLNTENARSQLSEVLGFDLADTKAAAAAYQENPSSVQDVDALIKRCMLSGYLADAAECCMTAERYADALAISALGSIELQASVRKRYAAARSETGYMRILSALYDREIGKYTANEPLDQTPWQQLLMCSMAYCDQATVTETCAQLGHRMEEALGPASGNIGAQLCHMSSGNLDNVVRLWAADLEQDESEACLQSFVHRVAVYEATTHNKTTSEAYVEKTTQYAEILASLGMISAALRYVRRAAPSTATTSHEAQVLYDRLYHNARPGGVPAPFPFDRVGVPTAQAPRDQFLPSVVAQPPPLAQYVDPTPPPIVQQQQQQVVAPARSPVVAPITPPVYVAPTPAVVVAQQQPPRVVAAPPVVAPIPTTVGGDCLTSPTDNVPHDQMDIVTLLRVAVSQVGDKRKRESIDKALCVLFASLNQRTLPADVVGKLTRFAKSVGSAEAKDIIKSLGSDHWDCFKPFMNIKFL